MLRRRLRRRPPASPAPLGLRAYEATYGRYARKELSSPMTFLPDRPVGSTGSRGFLAWA